MDKKIPTYQLNILSREDNADSSVFFLKEKVTNPVVPIDIPYRTNYFGIGICIRGKAELRANLESYLIEPGFLVTMSPHVIKQWQSMSEDFETQTIFFTEDYITHNYNLSLGKLHFFDNVANHAFKLSAEQKNILDATLFLLEQKYSTANTYRDDILRSAISILLHEVTFIYNQQESNITQNRCQLLAFDFKKLVADHFTDQRNLMFYADKLFVTAKHLSHVVRGVTGKTAGEWIDETVILEAKVLLQNPSLTISQIAAMLNFPDQSAFGRFFKNITRLSPSNYKKQL